MPALNTDLARFATPNFATTLANSMLISDTSMTLQTATGLLTTTAITLVIDATDPVSGVATPNLKEVVTGTLSGTVVSNLNRGQDSTTQQAHASGANVVMWITANLWNDLLTSYLTQHKQLGTHTGITTDTISTTGNATIAGTLGVNGVSSFTSQATFAVTPAFTGGLPYTVLSNPYKFLAYTNTTQSVSVNTFTKVTLNTEEYDTSNNFDSTTNYRFTAPIAGFYAFYGVVYLQNLAAGTQTTVALYKNGSSAYQSPFTPGATASNDSGAIISSTISLAINDYIELFVDFNTAGPKNIFGQAGAPRYTYLTGHLISAT